MVGQTEAPYVSILDVLFEDMGVPGVYARTKLYEDVVDALNRLITEYRPAGAEVFRFPPVVSLANIERQGYLESFPQLLGCVCCLEGSEDHLAEALRRSNGDSWTKDLRAAQLALNPAACYPVYPIASKRGPVPADGFLFDVSAECFRHEPSRNIDRFQSFRMREFVRVGRPVDVVKFREHWMRMSKELLEELCLDGRLDRASDPFFGRYGKFRAADQVEQALKFELLISIRSEGSGTACMSFNYHRDHFAKTWNLTGEGGEAIHSACVAFGIDRLAVALFVAHGQKMEHWPESLVKLIQKRP